jgi:hypothetical protein
MLVPQSDFRTGVSNMARRLSSNHCVKFATAILCVFAPCGLKVADAPHLEFAGVVKASFLSRTNGLARLFSSVIGTQFERNPKFWLRGVSGAQAIHAGGGAGAMAITPWHVLGANHWKQDVGAHLYFCDAVGKTVTRTVVAGTEIRSDVKSDIFLAVLDKALPNSIAPLPLMPSDWSNHIGSEPLLVTAMNHRSEFGIATLISPQNQVGPWFRYGCSYCSSALAPNLPFLALHAGDSGHPIMTLVDTNLILLGHITLENGDSNFSGPDYSSYASDIQSAISSLGTNNIAKTQKLRMLNFTPPYLQ